MPVVGAMAENATLFLVYGQVQRLIRNVVFGDDGRSNATLPLPYIGLSAACAGATASFILTPIELVKCRMQVQEVARVDKSKPLAGPLGIVRSAIRQNGLRALWLGQTGTLLRETGGSAVWFCTFETMVSLFVARRQDQQKLTASSSVQKKLYKSDLSSVELMISGAISGILYNLVFFPADSIKSTIQTASELRPGEPTTNLGFIRTGREIVASRGWKGIYAGCGITCLRGAPSSALIFWIVSRLESRFG
ncbi:mitochondrial carrier domain-containing protein [Phakopsora pachyrhizi]|nr:mitochondrial carrier domain-containing protein [Phakopsora pachyrhizi]